MIIFKDRRSAGILLAERMHQYKGRKDTIVFGIPRGGVVVAYEVAKALKLPLDVVITRKISDPHQPELALGAVDPDGQVVWDSGLLEQPELKIKNFKFKIEEEMNEIKRREKIYRKNKEPLDVKDKVVIVVDDGIATGETMLSAVKYLKRKGAKKVVVSVPVGVSDAIARIVLEGVESVVLFPIPAEDFQPVSSYFQNFGEVEDQTVKKLLVS
ncbi:phosphoribosyltransferase [Candidatus Daviesbacteria bacterium]|nr:phosphoribosyltransferase [Candidatus Daviesbacteria bacterium]